MSDEQIRQRIAYLVEHGGMWEDPLRDLRRGVRLAVALASMALLVEVGVALLLLT